MDGEYPFRLCGTVARVFLVGIEAASAFHRPSAATVMADHAPGNGCSRRTVSLNDTRRERASGRALSTTRR